MCLLLSLSHLTSALQAPQPETPRGLAVLPDNYFCCALIQHLDASQQSLSKHGAGSAMQQCAECRPGPAGSSRKVHASTHRCVQCRLPLCLGHVHLHDDSHTLVPHASGMRG